MRGRRLLQGRARPHAEPGAYRAGDWLLFGAETTGLPDEAHDACARSGGIRRIPIDEDLQVSSRYELCRRVEETFNVPKDSFWTLHSTQKIRFAVQQARNLQAKGAVTNE